MIDLSNRNPHAWIARGGLPCLAMIKTCAGMPAYESASGRLIVMENLLAMDTGKKFEMYGGFAGAREEMFFAARSYAKVALRAPTDLAALHDQPEAIWCWRPITYLLRDGQMMIRLGSQMELEWRWGLAEVLQLKTDVARNLLALAVEAAESDRPIEEYKEQMTEIVNARNPELEIEKARTRARMILLDHLSVQQRIDLQAWDHFFVAGQINKLYMIEPGNGFSVVDPITHQAKAIICLHPDVWMPHDDVALAIKLAIDAGQNSEAELLVAGRTRLLGETRRVTQDHRHAAELEAALGAY